MFFTIPAQVYVEQQQEGQFKGPYSEFYPTVWDLVPYPEGTLTWSHLWFVVYLFVFCPVLLPVFTNFKIPERKTLKEKLSHHFTHPFVVFLLFILIALYYFTLYLGYPEQQSLLDDWFLFIFSIILVVYGYLSGGSQSFWETCEKYRFYYLSTALLCIALLYDEFWWQSNLPKVTDRRLYLYGTLNSIHIWTLILTILGFAKNT